MLKKAAVVVLLCIGVLGANGATIVKRNLSAAKQKMLETALPDERRIADAPKGSGVPLGEVPAMRTLLGTYTGITGFFDYQTNAGACQFIRVDPSNPTGNLIHVIMMEATDSLAPTGPTRGTYYVYSTNAGVTWNSFSSLRVPSRRSGYPSLSLLQGSTQGTIIANHNDAGTGNATYVYVDSPPGSGAFAEIGTPPAISGGADEPIWPVAVGAADGSIVVNASRSTANTDWRSRTTDFVTWDPWTEITPSASAGIPTKANTTGRVGCLMNSTFASNTGIFFIESTNSGATWPATASLLVPLNRIAGPDTFQYTLGSDLVYNGDNLNIAFAETNVDVSVPTDSAQITFWSAATGFVAAATKKNTTGVAAFEHLATLNTITMDMPSIGLSGSAIVIAYHAMMENDTSLNGYNCSDIFMVSSANGGLTWSAPRNLSQSPGLDDRFVSVSPWNPPGFVNLVWQEDTQAGGNIIADPGATINRTQQKFLRTAITGIGEGNTQPASFSLGQNYPNPFNPSTVIDYTVAQPGRVMLKVYNTLGQEVATILNEQMQPGSYQATFNASSLSSGIYYYTMTTGSFSETKKMLLMK